MMDLTAYFKRGSIGDHNVSVLADFKRTNPVSNSDMLGCADRNCAEECRTKLNTGEIWRKCGEMQKIMRMAFILILMT